MPHWFLMLGLWLLILPPVSVRTPAPDANQELLNEVPPKPMNEPEK